MPLWMVAGNARAFIAVGKKAEGVIAVGLYAKGAVAVGLVFYSSAGSAPASGSAGFFFATRPMSWPDRMTVRSE